MCEKCDGEGYVIWVEPGYDWYEGGGFSYESICEEYCDCAAGKAERERNREESEARAIQRQREEAEAIAAGVDYIPF